MNRKIILVFVLTLGFLSLLDQNALAAMKCEGTRTFWYDCPTRTASGVGYIEDGIPCGCNKGKTVDCNYAGESGLQYDGECKKGTRKYRIYSVPELNNWVCRQVANPGTITATVTYGSWVSVSDNSTYCPKECTTGQKQYQIVDCSEQVKTCCNGYWSAWNQSCAANGYLP